MDATFYNEAARICGKIYKELKERIQTELKDGFVCEKIGHSESNAVDILKISELGNSRILEETSNIYKKNKNKGIASPVSISLNNCIGNYIYDEGYGNSIKKNDVVKIDFSVSVCGYIATIGETFIAGVDDDANLPIQKSIKFLEKLQKDIIEVMIDGETNDETRMMIESKCTENGVFPIENCISYQQFEGHCKMAESKYMILNYTKYWDDDDNLVSEENLCFELLENEVYTINLTMILTGEEIDIVKYTDKEESHLYRFNDYHYQLKLKNSRTFFSEVKQKHMNYIFDIREYKKNVKNRMGIRECYDNNILEDFPITMVTVKCDKNHVPLPVISKKFTMIVKKDKSYILKYY
jgi:methionine aminopeptidase